MKELGKFLLAFTSVAVLMGIPFWVGIQVGENNQSRALQGCEVVASQAVQDKDDTEAGLYETIEYFQNRLFVCDTILSNMELP